MNNTICSGDVYHVFRTVLNELPQGTATLKRDDEWGRSELIPSRRGAACLYGIGNVEDCEIGIVELTHSHFKSWKEAIEFCHLVVYQGVEYTVWRDGDIIVRAQRHHHTLPHQGRIIDVMSALETKANAALSKERLKFERYL
jgi:hypothetical protein